MKTNYVLLFLILLASVCQGQEYSFSLYFEDSVGNKDTLVFGVDKKATFGVDESLGEVNIIATPIDTIFDVFFTDAATIPGIFPDGGEIKDNYLELTHAPTYILKKQSNDFNSFPNYWIELGLVAKNWPITISWNRNEMENYVSEQGNTSCNLFLYSWRPPQSLIGDVHCCGYWPNDFTILNETSQVTVDRSNFCHYSAPSLSKDSINLFYVYYSSFTKVLQTKIGGLSCWYNSNKNTIVFSAGSEIESCVVEVFDLNGRLLITETTDNDCSKNYEIEASALPKGSYIVVASSSENKSQIKTQKIQVQ